MTQIHQIFWLNHMQMYFFKHGDDEPDHFIDLSPAAQDTCASVTELSTAQRLESCLLDVRKALLRTTQGSNAWPGMRGGSRQAEEPSCCWGDPCLRKLPRRDGSISLGKVSCGWQVDCWTAAAQCHGCLCPCEHQVAVLSQREPWR